MELQEILDKIDNNELDTLTSQELDEALAVLSLDPQFAAERQAIVDYKNAQRAQENANNSAQISDEDFARNAEVMEEHSEHYQIDEESERALNAMVIVNDEGKVIDAQEEITEAAKLRVATDNVEQEQPLSPEEYNRAVHDEIARILATIILNKGKSVNGESMQNAQQNAEDLQKIYSGEPVEVNAIHVADMMSIHSMTTRQKNNNLKERFKNSKFFKAIKNKLDRLDEKLGNKFGDAYKQDMAALKQMVKDGNWIEAGVGATLFPASILAAGTVAAVPVAVGVGLYSAYIGGSRTYEFIKAYQAEAAKARENEQSLSFADFMKEHKKDAVKTGLYAGAGIAGVGSAFFTAATTAVQSFGTAALHAGATKLTLSLGAMATPDIADAVDAYKRGDWKALKAAGKRLGVKGLTTAVFFAIAGMASAHNAPATDTNIHTTPVDSLASDTTQVIPADTTQVQPVADGSDMGDTGDTSGASDGQGQDATATGTMEKIEIGDREQAWYEKNLRECVKPQHINGHWYPPQLSQDTVDIILANIDGGIVTLPDGMSPEMAINMARIEALNYGKPELLEWLSGCDVEINGTQELYDLTKVTYTKFDGVHWLGDHIDFQGDMNRHGSADIHCGDSHIHGYGSHHAPAPQPAPAPVVEPEPELVVDYPAQPEPAPAPEPVVVHANGGQDEVEQLTNGNPDDVKIKLPAEEVVVHADGNQDVVEQLTGGNPEPVKIKLTPELMSALTNGGNGK